MRTVAGRTDRVVVVGAGLGGLSAALHLAGSDRQVTLLERADAPGGRAGVYAEAGYTFDTGPTVLTMPEIVAECLAAVGETLEDWLTLRRLDPAYRARFADGTTIDVHADREEMAEEIRAACGPADAAGYQRMVDWLTALYRTEMSDFIDRNFDSVTELATPKLLHLLRLGAFGRLAPKVAAFVRDERLHKLFTFQAMYAGLAPAQALAIYGVITYMDCVRGVYFPLGGMHALPSALANAATKHGVEVRYTTPVARVEIRNGRASAVHTVAGERIPADVVVINADLPTAHRELLPDLRTPRRVARLRYSPSAVVLHVGSRFRAPDPAHHTISFGGAWESTFDDVIYAGRPMRDPSFLLTNPTVTDPSLAPADRQTYYALFPTPNLEAGRIDWRREAPAYRDTILSTIDSRGFSGFSDHIEVSRLVTPEDWANDGIAAGAPFAAAHTFRQTGPFRPPTLDRQVDNLVWCGSNVQPGVGVPIVLLSGKLAAQRVTGGR